MTECSAGDPRVSTGYRLDQLASAFDRVRNDRDWKAPIKAIIHADERAIVEQAVRWFTATVPTFTTADGLGDQLVVVASGYRLGSAGDATVPAAGRAA